MALRGMVQSRALLALGVVAAAAVPAATLPRLPQVSPWPVLAGLLPWIVGKYVLCPLRWRVLTTGAGAPASCGWYLRANAESEVFGLLTPGHVGADVWRTKRLTSAGLSAGDALLSVGMDRLVGAVGLVAFVVFGATTLPTRMLLTAVGLGLLVLGTGYVVRRIRPDVLPRGPLPRPRALMLGLLLAAGYQLTIAGLLLGTIAATGNTLSPFQILAAFGASQVAAAVPGPNGASPRDGALVVALVALGVPLVAAAAAVTLRATLAWLPALTLGGISLWLLRRQNGTAGTAVVVA